MDLYNLPLELLLEELLWEILGFGFHSILLLCRWSFYGLLRTGCVILGVILTPFAILLSPILVPMGIVLVGKRHYYKANPSFEDIMHAAGKQRREQAGKKAKSSWWLWLGYFMGTKEPEMARFVGGRAETFRFKVFEEYPMEPVYVEDPMWLVDEMKKCFINK